MMENCIKCNFQVNETFKYCPSCGDLLLKKCYECDKLFNQAFNFCPECGEVLKLSDKKAASSKQKETQPPVDTIRKDGDKKVKIGVLNSVSGILEPIKQAEGGGNRFCYLYDSDTFDMVLKKITLIYFPGN
jgi:hypothetical protein